MRASLIFCELMKATRRQPMSATAIAEETGIAKTTVRRWLRELEEHGFVERAMGPPARRGFAPFTYVVSSRWKT